MFFSDFDYWQEHFEYAVAKTSAKTRFDIKCAESYECNKISVFLSNWCDCVRLVA